MATLMMQKSYPGDCTVTVCHSRSKNLKEMCLAADIIIVALGVPEFLKGDMVKEGAVIVDVGTTRMPSSITKSGFKLTGDVLFNEVAPQCLSLIHIFVGHYGSVCRYCQFDAGMGRVCLYE